MCNVAEQIIKKCAGHENVARYACVDVSRVYRWTYPKERGGTGGLIPTKRQHLLLSNANAHGVSIGPSDFFPNTDLCPDIFPPQSPVVSDVRKLSRCGGKSPANKTAKKFKEDGGMQSCST